MDQDKNDSPRGLPNLMRFSLELTDTWSVRKGGNLLSLTVSDIFRWLYEGDLHDWDECQTPEGGWLLLKDVFIHYGRYCRLSFISAGSFGSVYKGWDLKVEEMLAIKFLNERIPDPQRRELTNIFVTEAVNTARLSMSSHVIKFIHLDHNVPFLALQYCDGGSLSDRLNASYTLAEAISWAYQIASAISDAHRLQPTYVVHHDLKPANILLHRGKLLVSDFGGAMKMWNSPLAQTILPYGYTTLYAAPEITADRAEIPKAMDIWSFGVILWELFTGICPFRNNGEDPVPKTFNPRPDFENLPPVLEKLIRECLQFEPSTRPDAEKCLMQLTELHK